jgi:23S rRNA pseudouridine1911/1915/1917 synthase
MAGRDQQRYEFTAGEADAGRRLDQVLAARVPGLSRRQARVAIDIGGVFVDRARVKVASRPVDAGQRIAVALGGAFERATKEVGAAARAADAAFLPPFAVVHEDDDLVVVDKPAGLLTAPTPESDRGNLADLLARRGGGRAPIFVVHRIDLETSGLLVLAKSGRANHALSAAFREHAIEREYLAALAGALPVARRTVDVPVAGRRAVTHLAVEDERGPLATLVRARLETGRTHQIRIHCRGLGHPVLGDRKYGTPTAHDPPRMALHAARLGFVHPATAARLDFTSPWPVELAEWWAGLQRIEPPL